MRVAYAHITNQLKKLGFCDTLFQVRCTNTYCNFYWVDLVESKTDQSVNSEYIPSVLLTSCFEQFLFLITVLKKKNICLCIETWFI